MANVEIGSGDAEEIGRSSDLRGDGRGEAARASTGVPILVYEKHGSSWPLGALEWVFSAKPAKAPLAGATYGSFPAACLYEDRTWFAKASADACARTRTACTRA